MTTKGGLTRQKIIKESMQLFSARGYFHTSIADIIQASGLSKGGLYNHFRSKEEIWYAACDECTKVWKSIVFRDVRKISDPLERIRTVIDNNMRNYLGSGIFEGGCFLFNSLVEFSRQSAGMRNHILEGYRAFADLLYSGLDEAARKGMLPESLDLRETANFIVIALSGAGPVYASSRDPGVWKQTISQLHLYIDLLEKQAGPRSPIVEEASDILPR